MPHVWASKLTRRTLTISLAASSLLTPELPAAATPHADSSLLALGRDFDAVAAKLDDVLSDGGDPQWKLLDELARLDAAIVATKASTMEGLCVKARAACWALLGDLDPEGQSTTDKRMALSIVRDLIRLCAPDLERPGALTRLVEGIERDASNSTAATVTGVYPKMTHLP